MNTQNENRRAVFKTLSVVCTVLGAWLGIGTLFLLITGFAEEGYHKREFDEALPTLIVITAIGFGFLVAAWFFWRASRVSAKQKLEKIA